MIEALEWDGQKGFAKNSIVQDWYVGNEPFGTYTSRSNLTHVVIYNASHMVPVDKSDATLDIINRLIGVQDVITGVLVEKGQKPAASTSTRLFTTPTATSVPETIVEESPVQEQYGSYQGLAAFLVLLCLALVGTGIYYWRNRGRPSIFSSRAPLNGGSEWHELSNIDEDELFSGRQGWHQEED